MKTPDEIKKALEICADGNCYECPYYSPTGIKCLYELPADAMNYIQQLEDQFKAAVEHVKQLKSAQPQRISVDERMQMPEPPKEQK